MCNFTFTFQPVGIKNELYLAIKYKGCFIKKALQCYSKCYCVRVLRKRLHSKAYNYPSFKV
jgi:hypothetical protein